MAEAYPPSNEGSKDRGLFDCFGNKEEESKEDVPMADAPEHKFHRSNSSSSSSSEEEVEVDGVKIKRKKKKGVAEKMKEKLTGHHDKEEPHVDQAVHPVPEENKGFMDKIKEKIPGHHKPETTPAAPVPVPAPTPPAPAAPAHVEAHYETGASPPDHKEKKGIFEKIMEKLPGGHKNGDEAKNEHH